MHIHPPHSQRRLWVSLRTLCLTLLALALIPAMFMLGETRALAHDVLVDQTPQPGEVLDEAPAEIVLSYNNNLMTSGVAAITVTDAAGTELDLGAPTIDGRDAKLATDGLDDGAYHVVWSVVSSDGHRIAGQFVFGVGADSAQAVAELEEQIATAGDDHEHDHADGEGEHDHGDHADEATGLGTGTIVGISLAGVAVVIVAGLLFWRKSKNTGPPAR